ncbi:MAG: hypothetical protein WC543_00905 [Candidatus Omnitrophota bacterium]
MKISKKAQSTLEYVIILAAIVGGILLAASLIKGKLENETTGPVGKIMGKAVEKVGEVDFTK